MAKSRKPNKRLDCSIDAIMALSERISLLEASNQSLVRSNLRLSGLIAKIGNVVASRETIAQQAVTIRRLLEEKHQLGMEVKRMAGSVVFVKARA